MASLSPPTSPQGRDSRPRAGQRTSTMASKTSTRSRLSTGSGHKMDLTETSKDKRRLNKVNDPTQALNEAQPAAAAQQQSTLDDLRNQQYKDVEGNVITDPDRSNPTRHRLERPLDTIRAFNAAADGTTTRRSSNGNHRPAPGWQQDSTRRSSYYGNGPANGNGANHIHQPRPRQAGGGGGYYRNSSYGHRPEGHFPEDIPEPPYGRPPRNQSQPYYDQAESNSAHSYGHSYETMTSGSDEYGKSTNPSSQNSSFDQIHQVHQQRKQEEYQQQQHRLSQYDNEMAFSAPAVKVGNAPQPTYPPQHEYFEQQPQQPPQQQQRPQQQRYNAPPSAYPSRQQPGRTTSNSNQAQYNNAGASNKAPPPQKRQSWIKRTFSRRGS